MIITIEDDSRRFFIDTTSDEIIKETHQYDGIYRDWDWYGVDLTESEKLLTKYILSIMRIEDDVLL